MIYSTKNVLRMSKTVVLWSLSRTEPHHLVGAGARAVTQWGSGSDTGIKRD
jgi:hypothetical protein